VDYEILVAMFYAPLLLAAGIYDLVKRYG